MHWGWNKQYLPPEDHTSLCQTRGVGPSQSSTELSGLWAPLQNQTLVGLSSPGSSRAGELGLNLPAQGVGSERQPDSLGLCVLGSACPQLSKPGTRSFCSTACLPASRVSGVFALLSILAPGFLHLGACPSSLGDRPQPWEGHCSVAGKCLGVFVRSCLSFWPSPSSGHLPCCCISSCLFTFLPSTSFCYLSTMYCEILYVLHSI